jgi:hypothetical protein
MTRRSDVDLNSYTKDPRLIFEVMWPALLHGGMLHPLMSAVAKDHSLRFEIRYKRFNVYYRGGSVLMVDGRKRPWEMTFDKKYFQGIPPATLNLSSECNNKADVIAWVNALPILKNHMERFWKEHPNEERKHCQNIAAANTVLTGLPSGDYLVLDLEYQFAHRRFDLIAARRRPTDADPSGWSEPDLIFVEVKSALAACSGESGIGAHVRDFTDIVLAREGKAVLNIKTELQQVVVQKQRLGLISDAIRFKGFSNVSPELLIVLVNLKDQEPSILAELQEVRKTVKALGGGIPVRLLSLTAPHYSLGVAAMSVPV